MSKLDIVPPYAVHNDTHIKGFFGPYRFLSNFGLCPEGVWMDGQWYMNSENAYQAQKVKPEFRATFSAIKPGLAKKDWKNYPLAYTEDEFNLIKVELMAAVVFDKFFRNIDLRLELLKTKEKFLEETNSWNDVFWGCDPVLGGNNHLGKILMAIRFFWVTKG